MVRIRRFNVVKTSTVVALMYMVIVAIFAIPFFLFFAIAGVSVNGGPTQGRRQRVPAGLVVGIVAALFYGAARLGLHGHRCACSTTSSPDLVGGIEVEVDRPEPPRRHRPG